MVDANGAFECPKTLCPSMTLNPVGAARLAEKTHVRIGTKEEALSGNQLDIATQNNTWQPKRVRTVHRSDQRHPSLLHSDFFTEGPA